MLRAYALISAVILALTGSRTGAQDAWETVRSPIGQFSVELPAKPDINKSRERDGVGGKEKTVLLGCKTNSGMYIAYKIILATAIVKGTEDAELDAERDSLAKEWNGKVISERRIRAGDTVGRDFTIRGKPDKGEGVLTIRVRQYLSDKSVYLVAVVSQPNKELPDDSGRFLGSLMIGNKRAEGSPAPEPKGVPLLTWGEASPPAPDSDITGDKERVRIKILGTRKEPESILNSPRVMREVEGDFVITVKVVGEFPANGKSINPKTVPFNGAGILVWSDPDNYIRLERAAITRQGRYSTYVNFAHHEGGGEAASHNDKLEGGDCWVRMERKGSSIHGSISFDGKTWKDLKPIQTVWPAKLKIGVSATSSSNQPFSVAFEELEFKEKGK